MSEPTTPSPAPPPQPGQQPAAAGAAPPAPEPKPDPVIVWLEAPKLVARWDADSSLLAVTAGGKDYADARAVRAFPASLPDEYVEISDSDGKPVGMIRKVSDLSAEARGAVQSALAWRYLTPQISEVLELSEPSPFLLHWQVATDRGERSFMTESPREAVKFQGADGLRIVDLAGNNYEVRSRAELPAASRAMLDNLL